jgi:hypothetical protein
MSAASDRYREHLRDAGARLIDSRIGDPAVTGCVAGLHRIEKMLGRPLRIVVLGEYNSGKTSVTDLLIGTGLLPISVVSNTGVPVLVSHAAEPALHGIDTNGARVRIDGDDDDPLTDIAYGAIHVALPLPWLRQHQILDTPATAAPAAYVAEADIVLWCTVATRAWTESERSAWKSLPARCYENAILVATHKDSIYTDEECSQVMRRLESLTRGAFREVVLVSAAQTPEAAAAIDEGDDAAGDAVVLRRAVAASANRIMNRRLCKARRIVSRIARLAFHEFGREKVQPEAAALIARWEGYARAVLEDLKSGRKPAPATIEALLHGYAACAERLRSGVVTGKGHALPEPRASTVPLRWPDHAARSVRQARDLAADLTALLRLLAGSSPFEDPAVRRQYQSVRATLLALADLDGTFDALAQMLCPPEAARRAAS